MKNRTFKFLTQIVFLCVSVNVFAAYIDMDKNEDYLRIGLHSINTDHLQVERKGGFVHIKTLDLELHDKLAKELKAVPLDKRYFKKVNYLEPNQDNNVPVIELVLSSKSVEMFTFYKGREKRKVLDFWVDADSLQTKKSAIKVKNTLTKKPVVKKRTPKKKKVVAKKVAPKKTPYRDFRYGASFIWNYEALSPRIVRPLNIERKTPEYFYPIKNREYTKSDKEGHLQLAINLYRKKKWGLMYKSLRLYTQKYGDQDEIDIREYLKANAILRENLMKGNTEPVKMSIAMFQNISSRAKDYEMRKGVSKYLLTYYLDQEEYIQALELSKKLYIDSKENFDYEESDNAAEYILFSLARLGQVEKVRKLTKEKTIVKLLPRQTLIAYEMYAMLKQGESEEVYKYYERVKKGLSNPVHEAILYNTAEAYFRNAKYKKAIKVYDEFLANHSYHTNSSQARLRIALAYDILDKDPSKVEELYKNAINRSQNIYVGYEARVRYVGLRSIRKNKLSTKDKEAMVFIDFDNVEKFDDDLKKLLWLTRLRTMIKNDKFTDALSFLSAMPLKTMKPEVKKVFDADGAEIVYGIMKQSFDQAEYAKVYRAWEIYKDVYVDKVALDPYLNFIVAKSLLKMKLYKEFDIFLTNVEKLKSSHTKTFPIWLERPKNLNLPMIVAELKLIKYMQDKNWGAAKSLISKSTKLIPRSKRYYYQSLIDYHTKNYAAAEKGFEKYLSDEKREKVTDQLEVAKILKAYTDSIYEQGKSAKFINVARALLEDTAKLNSKNLYVQGVRERLYYLMLEMVSSEKIVDVVGLTKDIENFNKQYPNSTYKNRINFIFGVNLVKAGQANEGRSVFDSILKDEKSSDYLKEMVRAELSLLTLKERQL